MGIGKVVFCMHSLNSFPSLSTTLRERLSPRSFFFLPPQLSFLNSPTFPRFKLKRIHSSVDTRRHFTLDQLLVPIFHFRILIFSNIALRSTIFIKFVQFFDRFIHETLLLWILRIDRYILSRLKNILRIIAVINIYYIVRYF